MGSRQAPSSRTSPRTTSAPSAASRGRAGSGLGASRSGSRPEYICRFCNYVYDEKRGEPHRGIARGTKFADLPDDYCCPVCAVDERIVDGLGKVGKEAFSPLDTD